MFATIRTINDVLPFIANKKEISRIPGPGGSTTICYQFQDSNTFDSAQARECRGIVFDRDGNIAARPLHKFFNLGEHGETVDNVDWAQATRVMEKLDGSMIHTVWLDGKLYLKSKKSFDNSQTWLAWDWLKRPENADILALCESYAATGRTCIFELTSPKNRIVVAYPKTEMRLLHIRDNLTGEYYPLAKIRAIRGVRLKLVPQTKTAVSELLACLPEMKEQEGYVIQFENGHMLKVKCPWYLQLHRTVSFTRERDIAEAALNESLDDIKAALAGMGHDLAAINEIESSVKYALLDAAELVNFFLERAKLANMDRKAFALHYKDHTLFSLLMPAFTGKEPDYKGWYRRNRLKAWSLNPVKGIALEDA